MKSLLLILLVFGVASFASQPVDAAPALQIYLEGATYNTVTQSWEFTASSGDPLRLWVIGNLDNNQTGPITPINNVRLSVSYLEASLGIGVFLTPSTASGFAGITDTDTPDAPVAETTVWTKPPNPSSKVLAVDGVGGEIAVVGSGLVVTNGGRPVLGPDQSTSNKYLAEHGIFNRTDNVWQEFFLGDFDQDETDIGDFINAFPTDLPARGQINVYEVTVTGATDDVVLHFDVYDTIEGANHGTFAPFSHDGNGTSEPEPPSPGGVIPEPGSLAVWTLFAMLAVGFYRQHRSTKVAA